MGKQYFIFVANDISISSDGKISAVDIKEKLLENHFWAFTETAPLRTKLNKGDEILLYLAGPGRREFVATATVASLLEEIDKKSKEREILVELGLGFLKYLVKLDSICIFEKGIKIVPLRPQLDFIVDKKNYGLHLRLPIVRLQLADFQLILKHKDVVFAEEAVDGSRT